MLVRFLILLLLSTLPCAVTSTENLREKPTWSFTLVSIGLQKTFPVIKEYPMRGFSHLGQFTIFFKSKGIQVTGVEINDLFEEKSGIAFRGDAAFQWSIKRLEFTSYLPITFYYTAYLRQLGAGNLSLHGYLKCSLFNSAKDWDIKDVGEFYQKGKTIFGNPYYFYKAYKSPSYAFDIGIDLHLNPLRFVPFWLRLGILRMDYGYNIPKSFKEQGLSIPKPILTRLYVSYGVSLSLSF